MSNQEPEYDIPPGWQLLLPPPGVARPLQATKSLSKDIRQPVIEALNKAGRAGLTEARCGQIAYPSDDPAVRRGKQPQMVRNICLVDGHPLAFCPGENRVALARHFRKP